MERTRSLVRGWTGTQAETQAGTQQLDVMEALYQRWSELVEEVVARKGVPQRRVVRRE